jgi:hypothetical protein
MYLYKATEILGFTNIPVNYELQNDVYSSNFAYKTILMWKAPEIWKEPQIQKPQQNQNDDEFLEFLSS